MRRLISFLAITMVLTACQPATSTAIPTAIVEIPATSTSIASLSPSVVPSLTPEPSPLPSSTPTETALPALILDNPFTTRFDLTNFNVMPTIDNEKIVTSGQLANLVIEYFKQTGMMNPDGSVNLPHGVIPARPDQFKIISSVGSRKIFIKPDNTSSWGPISESPLQSTTLLFKLADGSGILTTELLYYKDNQENIKIAPVFFFLSSSFISEARLDPSKAGLIKTIFGFDSTEIMVSVPWIGIDLNSKGQPGLDPQIDSNALTAQSMQATREKIAQNIVDNGAISEISNVWWGASAEGPFTNN